VAIEFQQRLVAAEQADGFTVACDFQEFLVVPVAASRQCRLAGAVAGALQQNAAAAVIPPERALAFAGDAELWIGQHQREFRESVRTRQQNDCPPLDRHSQRCKRRIGEMPKRQDGIGIEDETGRGIHR